MNNIDKRHPDEVQGCALSVLRVEIEVSHDPCADTGEYERYLDSLGLDKGNDGDEGSGCTYSPVFRKPGMMILLKSIESLFFGG